MHLLLRLVRLAGLPAVAAILLAAPAPGAAPAATGTIEGRVLNAANGNYLNNARVLIEGSTREVLTNEEGEFRLLDVPAGTARVTVSYAGMKSESAAVAVTPGASTRRDFELAFGERRLPAERDVVQLQRFVVESTALSAQAAAINEQKMSPNIKNVVVLDEVGDLGDGNIGEYLKYTPGISIVSGPQTAASASIRGLPGSGIVFMIDGAEVSSPAADRSFDLAASSSGSVDRIEITKVPTPDRPANAVGGTINIVGKSGFSTPRRRLRINTYAAYNSDNRLQPPGLGDRLGSDRHSSARAIQPGFDLNYSHPVSKTMAFTVNLSQLTRVYDMDYSSPTWDLFRGVQTTSTEQNVLQATERQLASTTFDWKLSPVDSLRVNVEHVQINTPTRQNVFAVAWGAGNSGGATFTQGAAAGGDTVRQSMTYGDRTRGTTSALLRYNHEGRTYRFNAAANFSRSWDERKDLEHGFFRTIGTFSASSLIIRAEGLDGIYDRRSPRMTATTRTGQAFDLYDNANLTFGAPTSQPNEIVADLKSASANLARDFNPGVPVTVKTGFSVTRQRKDNTSILKSWTFSAPAAVSRLVKDHDLTNDELSRQTFFGDTLKVKWVSPVKYYNLFRLHPEWFTLNEPAAYQSGVTNSKYFEETISAGYVRTDVKLLDNKVWLVGGARWERTEDFGQGPLNDIRATYRQDANGNLLRDGTGKLIPVTTDPLATTMLRYRERGAVAERSYADWYPSLNATWYLTNALVARAAYARTLGRPNLTDIIPGITVTDPSSSVRTITAVNAGLQPWTADNYDVSLEAYQVRGAVVSVSLFQKNIRSFFVDTRSPATLDQLQAFGLSDDYLDYELITTANGGEATVKGYELSWRQSLGFLPSWAQGFSAYGNATISRASGPNASDFTPFAHKNLNWGVAYVRKAFSFRFNVAYAYKVSGASVAASATVPAGTASYVAPQITQDWSFEYRFLPKFSLYGGARNWNGANKRTERAGPNTPVWTRPQSYQNFGTLVTVGVRAEF